MPVFKLLTSAPPIAPVIQAKPKIGEPARASQSGILQRKCACGGASAMSGGCEECGKKRTPGLQTKLSVNGPGDVYEQEADRIADKVMAAPAERDVSMAPLHIQRFSGPSNGQTDAAPASVDKALASPGMPLEPKLRRNMEQRFGHDFSMVRVHSGAAAEQSTQDVNANAYTVGHNIVFGAGRLAPGTRDGQRLIAHELTHVAQQDRGMNRLQRFATCTPTRLSMEECPAREPGEAQRARAGQMSFLRLQVPPKQSGPVSGQRGALIANFDIGSAILKPNLARSSYWNAFLDYIASKDLEIEILGFSDCENKKGQNKVIREQRAAAVFNILPPKVKSLVSSQDGALISDCITENSTAADRTLNRSVALLFKSSAADFSPEEIDTPSRKFVCGPDVTPQVADAVKLTRSVFKGWDPSHRKDACDALISVWKGKCAWDIVQISKNSTAWISATYQPKCASKGADPKCGESVQIEDDCHFAGSANYVLFGAMFKLCSDEDTHWVFNYSKSNMKALIGLYKDDAPNYKASLAWANAGYDGWPSGVSSPYGDRANCIPICPLKYRGSAFDIHWYPHHKMPNWCGLGT
jgi:hypothetical protein